jgi:membrane-bound lytic murein transglycosylase MltF
MRLSRQNLLYLPPVLLIVIGCIGMAWFLLFPEPPEEDPLARVIYDHERALLMASAREGEATRFLTVLIPYDRTRFFIRNGQPMGFEFELVRAFEQHLNEQRRWGDPLIQAIYVPTQFSQLVPLLADGIGDIAAGGLTITPEREALVGFSRPYIEDVAELLVAHVRALPLERLDDLAGRRVVVLRGSSYVGSLEALNIAFAARGLEPVEIVEAAPELVTEDLLEMTHAGIIDYTVADRHIAELWAGVLPGIRVDHDLAVAEGGAIGWAFRNGAPELEDEINAFLETVRRGTLIGNVIFNRDYDGHRFIENPLAQRGVEDLIRYRELFERHASAHGLDWRLVAAVAYQESRLDPDARSPRGAVGMMQLLPSTAAYVGIDDPLPVDANIEAGVRYLAYLRDRVLGGDAGLDDQVRQHFMLAAYNAGPGRLRELRAMTRDQFGLDPDRWFFNVERAAQARVGSETVRYVTDVNKYWLAYQLGDALLAEREALRDAVN